MRFRRVRASARVVRLGALTTGLVIILAVAATGSFALRSVFSTPGSVAATVQATQSSTPLTPLIILPSDKACVAGGKLTIQFNSTPHGPWAKVTIYLNGKRLKTLKRLHITRLVTITGLPRGSFLIAVTGVTRAGRARAVNRRYRACPPKSSRTLSVGLAGTGSGRVTGSGISCPGVCSDSYPAGTMVTLTGAAESGSSFAGWSGGGCTGTASTCEVTMSAATFVTATFNKSTPTEYALKVIKAGTGSGTVTSSPPGIDCGSTCEAKYPEGETVTLTASATTGSEFEKWTGCEHEVGLEECEVKMSAAESVTAAFNLTAVTEYKLKVIKAGTGTGTVTSSPAGINCGATCEASFEEGKKVTLAEKAETGSTFAGWSGGGCSGTGTCVVTIDSAQDVTATFEKAPAASETPGSYTGETEGNVNLPHVYFYVAPDGGSLEDVDIPGSAPSCTPSGSVNPAPVGITSIPINSDGSFSSTTTQTGLVEHQPATFTYTFEGQFSDTGAITGTWREEVAYSNSGTSYSCTTGDESFTASLNAGQTGQNTPTASPGSYTGDTEVEVNTPHVYFYVAPDGGSIEDVDIPDSAPSCDATGVSVKSAPVGIASIPINSDGSFSSTTTQTGLVEHQPATFTYTFTGHFHGPTTGTPGLARVDGIWREDVTYANSGLSYDCTTGNESFSAVLDKEQTGQNTPTASPGSYTGDTEVEVNTPHVYFYVAPDGGSIEDVDIPDSAPSCDATGVSVKSAPVGIASIPINSDGSFSSTTTQTGLVEHQPATFTYTFTGHFHGPTTGTPGLARVDGIWREDVTYANSGLSYDCTTGNESFSAVLDKEQTGQNTPTASPGSYTGDTEVEVNTPHVYFYVAPDGGSIEDVDIPDSAPSCDATGVSVKSAPVGIASIPINSDGSFSSTTTQTGLVEHQPATFTYTFTGHFHGPTTGTPGLARVDGIWREDVTYANSGLSYDCTTGNESFSAVLDKEQTGQNTPTASPGSYTGDTEVEVNTPHVYFAVSSDSATIEKVSIPSIPSTSLECSPSGSVSSEIVIASIPIGSDGSFTYEESHSGLVGSEPATITYTFNGHVHGPNTSGDTRINGIWREDITYANDGTSYDCTTNNQSYSAVF